MLGLVIFLLVISFASVFAYVILEPVAKAARGKQWTSKFYMSDFFSLSFLLALPLVFVAGVRRLHGEDWTFYVVSLILTGVFAYTWWRGTGTLSRIGVLHAGRRCLFLGILMPVALLGSAIGVPSLLVMAFAIPEMSSIAFAGWLVCVVAAPIIAWCCRRAALWVVA